MKNKLLKCGVAICLMVCGYKFAQFVETRTPPFSVGNCYRSKGFDLTIKIVKNHPLDGYSEVESSVGPYKMYNEASFKYLKNDLGEKIPCP